MQINRHNYEEYFILYMDNELPASERRMVDEFVKLHPDLQEELSLLLQSKFTPDHSIVYGNKEDLLFANNIDDVLANSDEWLVLYIDNELNDTQRAAIEQHVANNPEARLALEQLQRSKLQAETIIFPDKESLYRREEKKPPVIWWRIAAAAVVTGVAIVSAVSLLNKDGGQAGEVPIAKTVPAKTQTDSRDVTTVEELNGVERLKGVESGENVVVKTVGRKENIKVKKVGVPVKNETSISNSTAVVKPSNNLPQPEEKRMEEMANLGNKNIDRVTTPAKSDLTNDPEFRSTIVVTNPATPTSSLQQPDETIYDSDAAPDGKKNKLRGFFRKVTRNFEKRTNIEATDDDDRLLVGGLAIRLK